MRNQVLLFLCVGLFAHGTSLYAQKNKIKTGIDIGYTYSTRQANLSNYINTKYTPGYGMGINLTGEYLLWRTLFVASGISFLQKNYKYERTGPNAGWYTKFKNSYLHMPLSVGGYLINNPYESKGIWIRLSGGLFAEYWLSMKRNGQYPVATQINEDGSIDYNKASERYDFGKNENRLRRLGYGLQGGGQLGYTLKNKKFSVYAAYNYQYGLSDINKFDENKNKKMTTRAYMISLGGELQTVARKIFNFYNKSIS